MKPGQSKSVQRLIRLGICQPSDITQARVEAEKLSSPEYAMKIRRAEKLVGAIGDSNRIKESCCFFPNGRCASVSLKPP